MIPNGWLDVHTHFYLPSSEAEREELVKKFRSTNFLVTSTSQVDWSPEAQLTHNDKADVAMSLLTYLPTDHAKLSAANDYAHSLVHKYPSRFGQLAALPTDNPDACLAEIERVSRFSDPPVDGFSATTVYNDAPLSSPSLDPVYELLNERQAVIHVHPNAYCAGAYDKPSPLIDIAFDTARVATDMLYKGVFKKYPNIRFIFAHCGGALPVLSGRLALLGTESWVPNSEELTRNDVEEQLARLYVDTAATAKTGLYPAAKMVGIERCLYGSDCGVPCSTPSTMEENMEDVGRVEKELGVDVGSVQKATWTMFPAAARRAVQNQK